MEERKLSPCNLFYLPCAFPDPLETTVVERVLRGGRSDAGPPRSLVVRGPELNTRLMETYAETRYSRGRRRSRSSPRSSSLFHSGPARLYLSAFPLLPEPLSPSTLCIPRRSSRRGTRDPPTFSNLFPLAPTYLRARVAWTMSLRFVHSSIVSSRRRGYGVVLYIFVKIRFFFFLSSFSFSFLRSAAASRILFFGGIFINRGWDLLSSSFGRLISINYIQYESLETGQ